MPQPLAKLTDNEQYQICQWFAEFKTSSQIRSLARSQFDKDISLKSIWQYAHGNTMKRWKPMIERLRQEWALGVMDIPLAHKRARLEKLVLLLNRAERLNVDAPTGREVERLGAKLPLNERDKIRLQVEILREMREEMEAGKAQFTNVYMTTINHLSDEEVLKQRDIVLSRLKQLGGSNGARYGREVEAEASGGTPEDALPGGAGDGGGLHRGLVGDADPEAPDAPEDSQGAGVPILEATDAQGDARGVEEVRPEEVRDDPLPEGEAVHLRDASETGAQGELHPEPPRDVNGA